MYAEEDTSPATLSEIYNQAYACAETIERAPSRLRKAAPLPPFDQYTDITGCGSSHHLARTVLPGSWVVGSELCRNH